MIAVMISGQSNQTHNMYPDLLKRLDDSSDDIRSVKPDTQHVPRPAQEAG